MQVAYFCSFSAAGSQVFSKYETLKEAPGDERTAVVSLAMLSKIQQTTRRLFRQVKTRINLHPSIRRYIAFCRRTWPVNYPHSRDSVVLVGLFHWNASVHCYAHVANHLARRTGSAIEWYYLHGRRNDLYELIFAAFGSRLGLTADNLKIDEEAAVRVADEIFAGLQSKWDVVNIKIDGVGMGDLIYDTYLRSGPKATIDIRDSALREIILQAMRFTWACRSYLARKRVVAIIVDHTVYLQSGIIARLGCCCGIPVYQVHYGPEFYVVRIETDPSLSDVPARMPWPRYRKLFGVLSPKEQIRARERGRKALQDRLEGKVDGVLFTMSAYGQGSTAPVLRPGTKPRVLVLLHEFCDTVHCYRRMLFTDFYEWASFLLRIAEQTPFEWYVKPHPSVLLLDEIGRSANAEVSRKAIAELQERFPSVHFLDPRISNRQIIAEGISAMFTVHGTAGHEFAYLGVPVVNAGDNPHVAYNFNIHPRTLEEYEHCIRHADELKIEIDREEIEEFFYMNYLYFSDRRCGGGNPIPAAFFRSNYYDQNYLGNKPEVFDYFTEPLPPEEARALESYFQSELVVADHADPKS